MHLRKHRSLARSFDRYRTDNIHSAQPRQRPTMFRLARSHQPSARSSRQRHITDARLHLLHVFDQPWEQGCFRGDAQPGHCCSHGDIHHLNRMRASQTASRRGPPFGPLVTRPIRTHRQYHRFDLHELVGKFVVRLKTFARPAYDFCSSSGRSGPLLTTSTAQRSIGHARCSSCSSAVRF